MLYLPLPIKFLGFKIQNLFIPLNFVYQDVGSFVILKQICFILGIKKIVSMLFIYNTLFLLLQFNIKLVIDYKHLK